MIMEDIKNACALTGHRTIGDDFSEQKLKDIFIELIREQNVRTFYCGMAIGFDLIACEILCDLRAVYPDLRVVACVPCPEQAEKFSFFNKRTYERLLNACDEKVIVSPKYDRACMHIRNRYMVDRAAFLVAYCNKTTGGSASTVRYAEKKSREIIFV